MNTKDDQISSKRVAEFIQLLFWGRLFRFNDSPGFSSIIEISPITIQDVVECFFKAVGYNFAKTGLHLDPDRDRASIKDYAPELSGEQLDLIFSLYANSYNEGATQRLA